MRIGVCQGLSINLVLPYGPRQAERIAPSPLSGKVGMVVNSEKIFVSGLRLLSCVVISKGEGIDPAPVSPALSIPQDIAW